MVKVLAVVIQFTHDVLSNLLQYYFLRLCYLVQSKQKYTVSCNRFTYCFRYERSPLKIKNPHLHSSAHHEKREIRYRGQDI